MSKQYAVRETKTQDFMKMNGRPALKTTWVLEYEGGHCDVLQRRQPIPIKDCRLENGELFYQMPGVVEPVNVKVAVK